MAWLSYSQNGEDVRLRRAFANQQSGFYIDVGANNPVEFSITKHFYDSGWSGINVEPAPAPFALVAADRQRDINLNVGCSNKAGSMVLYTGRGNLSALSTFTALQRRGIESRLVIFPDENHWILKPQNSLQWHKEVLGWLARWTQ